MIFGARADDRYRLLAPVLFVSIVLMAACHQGEYSGTAQASGLSPTPAVASAAAPEAALAALGREIFFDASLSASGRQSCASCHSPDHAYGPPDNLAVQMGGPQLDRQGMRAVPSLRYVLNRTPRWSKAFVSNMAERILEGDEPPAGGFGWDGRFNSLHEQAAFPLLAANEMANRNAAEVAGKIRRSAYAEDFRRTFGADIFASPERAFMQALLAIERFELDDASFHPYDSKFDFYLDGKVSLSPQEQRGLALFNDPQRGNCTSCHPDRKGADGSHPLFTDYQFEALGVPRNPEIKANADARYVDLGLCGPLRKDQALQSQYCGLFKTPSLRNVARRQVFFHNGRFHSLKEALQFYVQRDTAPQRWYPPGSNGIEEKFDDIPQKFRGNIDIVDLPLTRTKGQAPVWNDVEIDDVIAFLTTLNDGYEFQ